MQEEISGRPLVYLDNGATTQKPLCVIEALDSYYKKYNSNVHRGVHQLSQKATNAQEAARKTIANFINAAHDHEIIFTRGTTESINLVSDSFGRRFLGEDDIILTTIMEHHSNFVPWQMACEAHGSTFKAVPILEDGSLSLAALEKDLDDKKVKLLAVTWVSNTLGTVNPIAEIVEMAHKHNIPVLVDAAQAIQHLPIDVQALDIDFLAFSGHKVYGPTGIGVLYGKEKWLKVLPPYQGGGSMIDRVTVEKTTYADLPFKFEAGTPDVSGIIGLGKALEYVSGLGIESIRAHEEELITYALKELRKIPGLRIFGTVEPNAGAISFLIEGIHPFDLGTLLDQQGVRLLS